MQKKRKAKILYSSVVEKVAKPRKAKILYNLAKKEVAIVYLDDSEQHEIETVKYDLDKFNLNEFNNISSEPIKIGCALRERFLDTLFVSVESVDNVPAP
jgi:hypothetical protein